MLINKEKAIEIYNLVAGDNYGCTFSDLQGNNQDLSEADGSGMASAIELGEYDHAEFYLENADKEDAVKVYEDLKARGSISGEGYDEYDYHKVTIKDERTIEVSFIPVGGW